MKQVENWQAFKILLYTVNIKYEFISSERLRPKLISYKKDSKMQIQARNYTWSDCLKFAYTFYIEQYAFKGKLGCNFFI